MNVWADWVIFGSLALLVVLCFAVWWKYRPRIGRYLARNRKLDEISRQYNLVCKSRADFVYHYFWSIDSGELKEAAQNENLVLQADTELAKLRIKFDSVKNAS